ncbi:uncharacterized protein LOC119983739 [Tripterygium wilfordii]|uniref:uncharacterized protein LOC119983739 n=1 Tax=Tripterygium wilfordii TaxID=458696 RepID=UPI0018F7F698|nr:uncharacterized protein LOC119983739 [Tripterygium wilfordii]
MSTRGSLGSYSFQSFVELLKFYRSSSSSSTRSYVSPGYCQGFAAAKTRRGYSFHHSGLQLINSANKETWREPDTNLVRKDESNNNVAPPPPPPPPPPRFNFAIWAKMIFGSLLSFLLPFWSQKLQKIRQIQGETEMVVEEVEKVAEVVEKVAIAAEKLSGDVAENLPDSARLKQAALFLERISEKTAHDAHVTEDFMHKVDAVERDLDALENIVEPLINKFAEKVSVQKDGKSSAGNCNFN